MRSQASHGEMLNFGATLHPRFPLLSLHLAPWTSARPIKKQSKLQISFPAVGVRDAGHGSKDDAEDPLVQALHPNLAAQGTRVGFLVRRIGLKAIGCPLIVWVVAHVYEV